MARLENSYVNITARDILDAAQPLAGQHISGASEFVSLFENDVSDYFGVKRTVTVCSGTVAIYCALRAIGVEPGDEVILPATAIIMCGLPVNLLGAKAVFADITSTPSFGLDAASVESKISPRTKAVISVPLWGYPVPMNDLVLLCKKRNIPLIEDIAQAHGATWDGKLLGTFGDLGCASTHERKLITTGEGGFVLTNNKTYADDISTFRRYGINQTGIGAKLGLNLKLSGIAAAVGRTQVKKLDSKIRARTKVAREITNRLSGVSWFQELPVPDHSIRNYYTMVCLVKDPRISRVAVDAHLESQDVVTDTWRYGFKPLYEFPLFSGDNNHCPNAEKLIQNVFTLPTHEGMNEQDIDQVVKAVSSFAH